MRGNGVLSEPRAITLPELDPHKQTINQRRTDSGPPASCQGAADGFSFHPGYPDVQDGTYPPGTHSTSEVLCKIMSEVCKYNMKCDYRAQIFNLCSKIGIFIHHLSTQSAFSTQMLESGKGQI